MAEVITMPKLGFDMKEGTLASWVKKIGDSVTEGDILVEVETDKATVEVEVYKSGTLLKTLVAPGDIVQVGEPIAVVGAQGEDVSSFDTTNGGQASASVPEEVPVEVQAGDRGGVEAAPATNVPQTAPAAEEVHVGNGNLPNGVKASPLARRMAEEKHIDLMQVKGTGPGGRIIKSDVENFTPTKAAPAAQPTATPTKAAPAAAGLGAAPSYQIMENIPHETIDVSRMRATIGRRMVESKQYVPHFQVTVTIDTTALVNLRKQINEKLDDDHKVSVNDLVVKAVALTLRAFPNLNTHYHGDKLIRYKEINIGNAVALPQGGLINVVTRNADTVSLSVMAKKNKDMIAGAREGKVKPEDIEGSTFTVSNLGPFNVDSFTAIINPPEAGIVAVGTSQRVPVVNVNGEITIGNVMKATGSFDHRVTDGAEGAQFMKHLKELIEDPMRLLV